MHTQINQLDLHQQFCQTFKQVKREFNFTNETYAVVVPISLNEKSRFVMECYSLQKEPTCFWGLTINEVLDAQAIEILSVYLSFIRDNFLIGVFFEPTLTHPTCFITPLSNLTADSSQLLDAYKSLPMLYEIGPRQPFIAH